MPISRMGGAEAMHKIMTIGALFCALSSTSIPAAEAKPAADSKDLCRQGKSQYASGDVLKAIKTLGKCVEHEPRNREGWVSLANANLEAGRFPQSAEAFAKAESIKPGDEAFLAGYLSALEGAGKTEEQIPVLRALAGKKQSDRKNAERLLASVEAAGPDKYPDEYLFALQSITETPGADRYNVEKLAAAYLKRGKLEKAEAEYRGLLVKSPESAEDWAGLGASLESTDVQAAGECFRKAAFYSNNAGQRTAYQNEHQRLAKAASSPQSNTKVTLAEDAKVQEILSEPSAPPAVPAKEASKPVVAAAKPEPAKEAVKPAAPPVTPVAAKEAPKPSAPVAVAPKPKPFDVKAYQDSIYKAELEKRLAALHVAKTPATAAPVPAAVAPVAAAPSVPAPSVSLPVASKSDGNKEKEAREAEAKAKEEKSRQEALAKENEKKSKEEKERQEKLAKEAEKLAKEEKAKQEQLAREAEKKSKEDKQKQDELARKQAEADKQRVAVMEKAKQDSLSREADKKAKADKEKQEQLAREEKAKQDRQAKADKDNQELLAKANKSRQDSITREGEKKTKADKEKQDLVAKLEKVKQDSLAREADKKAKADKEKQEQMAKAEKDKQELLAKVAKAKQDSLAREADKKAKADKEKQELMAKAEKEKQELLARVEKARQDSLAREADRKAKADKAEKEKQEMLAKAEKVRQDSLARVAELKAKEEKARQEALAKEAERKAKEEKERIAKEEERKRIEDAKARKLKEDQDRRERLARERKDRYDRALVLYREGRMDTAALVFKTVLADSPTVDAFYYAARVYLAKGDFSKSLDALEKSPKDKGDLDGLKGKALMGLGKNKEALAAMEIQYAKGKDDSLLPDLITLKRKLGDEAGAVAYLEKLAEKRPGEIKYQEELAAYYRGKGDLAKASVHYSKVFILNTSHPEANYWLGMEAAKAGDNAQAVPMLERVVAANPARADAWKALAKGNAALGRKDQAWETHKKAFALAPSDLELAKGKLVLARESRPADLIPAYEDVLRIAPQDADASLGLAKLRFQEGNYAAAEKNYRVACKDSKDSRAWAEFGRSLLEQKKTDEAAVVLQKAVDLGEKDPSLRLDLARIRMDKGDLDWAEALLKDLAKKTPSDPEPLYWQGQIALKRQQTAVAEEFFRKSHQLKPDEGRYAESLARLLRDKDEWKPAITVLVQAEPNLTFSGRLLYGDCLAHGGDYAKAQEVYAALYKKEASGPLLSRRMDLLVRMGKAEQAVELPGGSPFQDATEVRFSLAKAQLALADAHVLKGDVDQAVDLMKMVVKTDDHRPEYHYYLGLGYFDQNRPKKALGEFTDALTYRVEYPEALYRKGLCLIQVEDVKEAENAFGELSQHADPVWKARGLYGLAMVFEAQGKPEAVQHHLERSIASSPLPEAMAYLSRVSLRDNKVPEAQEWARKALSADPSNEVATVALADALASGKKQNEAMELARLGLKAKPLSCGLMVQTAKMNFAAGKLDSTLAMSNNAIRICPEEKMAYYYAGVATQGSNRPKEAKQYFKSFRKLGGDKKMVPGE
ncbi:MAG: family finger-like domain/tetratricopeptide repeat protein [Fibrobacteres bacterium]|nr:family finger-like domain/tetratricopeptide repeat protein [Fibrobacterota bacterium]